MTLYEDLETKEKREMDRKLLLANKTKIPKLLEGKDFFNILEFPDITASTQEYLDQALEFLKITNSEILIKYDGFKVRDNWDNKPRDQYNVILKNPNGKYEFTFTNSIAKSRFVNRSEYGCINNCFSVPNAYDILACLDCMQIDSLDEYIQDFGIDIKSAQDFRNAEKTFNAIQHEEISLLRMYNSEEIEQLREIN